MGDIMFEIDNLPPELLLGRQTENGVVVISIDMQSWIDRWPGMEIIIMATRPGESEAYPVVTRMDGSSIVWTVNGADTAIAGRGSAEILGLVDGVRKLSRIVRTHIKSSIVASTMEPPEGAQPWVDEVINAANEIKNMTAQAETLQPGDAATASYADGKLTLGIPPGTKGDKGEKGDPGPQGDPGSDASVTAENIEAALGYAPVKDVQVAGNSVLDGGVADVPIASATRAGVIRIGNVQYSGIYVDQNGNCYISYATNPEIDSRTAQRKTVVCSNLDYAVKAAMCDGKGAAWTDAEQKAARNRMGVDKAYELIEEITLAEETGVIERDTELDGRAYNFTELKCLVIGKNSSGNNVYYALTSNRLNKLAVSIFSISGSNASYRSLAEISCVGAIVVGTGTNTPGYNATQATMLGTYNVSPTIYWPSGKIEGFIIRPQNAQSPAQLMAGTKIMIYGVRA